MEETGPALPRDNHGETQLQDASMSFDLRASLEQPNRLSLFDDGEGSSSFEAKTELVNIL